MKGIFLIISKIQRISSSIETELEKGLRYLHHRGDKENYFYFPQNSGLEYKIGIGINSDTKQLFFYNHIYVAFDGKLLNKKQIFQTYPQIKSDDTDEYIIAQLYTLIGKEVFTFCERYGSIILFDTDNMQFYASRDLFGTKPLFYFQNNDFIAVSSETRPIYHVFEGAKTINYNAVTNFLLWGDIVKHKQNFFSEIVELDPAHLLSYSFNDNTFEKKPYYKLPHRSCLGNFNSLKNQTILETTKTLFLKGIENHIDESSQLAIGLSGGLDSSSIACAAKTINKDLSITAFTAINEFDGGESIWAEKIVKNTNSQWIKVLCTAKQLMDECEAANYSQNIPLFNASSFAQYKIMQAAEQSGFKSIMDGQGSDELFGGYTVYFPKYLNDLFSEWMFIDGIKVCQQLSNANLSTKMLLSFSFKEFLKNKILSEKAFASIKRKEILNCLSSEKKQLYFSREKEKPSHKEFLNDYLLESYTEFLPHILRWGEHSAASFGIDCVMPFSDNRDLAEFIFDVPSIYKLHDGWGKYLLRFALKDIIPDEIRLRKQKMGFYTPENRWLEELKSEIKNRILDLPDIDCFIEKQELVKQWDNLFCEKNHHFKSFAFRCMSYLIWRNTLS